MSEAGKSDWSEKEFSRYAQQVPLSENLDPIKEGLRGTAFNPVEEGIAKQGETIRAMKSIGDFIAFGGKKTTVKVSFGTKAPELGKPFEMSSPLLLISQPVIPPVCGVRVETKKSEGLTGTEVALSAKQKLKNIQSRLNQQIDPKPMEKPLTEPSGPSMSDPKPPVSIERLVFLERVEKIMASEARIKEIEAENKTLIGMVSRLQKEIEELKARAAGKL